MKRRRFIQNTGVAAGVLLAAPSVFTACAGSDSMSRIGLTTVVFRNRFLSTNPDASGDVLSLEKIPEYYQDRFGIHQPEFWSEHFESRETSYLNDLKKALDKNRCRLINIQVDTPGKDMSDPENENSALAIAEIKEWIDVGAFLGAKMVRGSFMQHSLKEGIKSTNELVKYAKSRGITLLCENHFDLMSVPENHLKVAQEVGTDHFGLLADFGNYPETTDKYEALEMIAPYTLLVSAKTHGYDKNYEHTGFDFDRCVRIMEEGGFTGIYSLEQWEDGLPDYDYEKIVDWMITHVRANLG
ncbi:MAG: TIM barrel protein [Bacteroidota bacterium]|nr:TIM barrel protein [Bacteroidota bacterium]